VRVYGKIDGEEGLEVTDMDSTKKFKERYLAGEIEFEAIDDYSYEWGMSDEECTLAQYLGLNAEEEDAWVSESEEALLALLDAQKSI
jgi:hypothetical protein